MSFPLAALTEFATVVLLLVALGIGWFVGTRVQPLAEDA
jgi:hypothetical protein